MWTNQWMYDEFEQNGDVIIFNEWCCWLVYLSEYTWKSMYSGKHKNIDYLMWVSIVNKSTNVWFLLYEMEMLSDLMNDAVD